MSEEQVEQMVDEAFQEVIDDTIQDVIESIKDIEQKIFESHGDPDTAGEVWALISTADRDGTDGFEEDAIEAVLTGKGPDLYEGLANKELAVVHSLIRGKFGTLVRSGAWMGKKDGVRPSEDPEKKSCIITAAFAAKHVFFVVRFEDGTIEASSMNETEYMEGRAGGQQRLVDALLDFDYLPIALKEHEFDLYSEIMDKFLSQDKDE